jgi:predicted nuclease of predicted toxin-antitoxin system
VRILIDMNLSPQWIVVFERNGWDAVHWSQVRDHRASDLVIMDWARTNGHVIFTHDLDFGTLLAVTGAEGPSVVQVRGQDVLPEHMGAIVVASLRQYRSMISEGALVVVDESTSRARILPLAR